MIDADDGTSIGDSKSLLLDKAEFFVVGRILEQLGDRLGYYVGSMISGGMGMTLSSGFQPPARLAPLTLPLPILDCKFTEKKF